jgi:xanthine dehydrogenase small subunit
MRDHVILYVNGQRHEVSGERAFRSLADFLRYDLGLVGTKVVCAEGDCGSCTIFLGRPDRSDPSRIHYETVCSCIQFLCQLDAAHVVTVEGLKYDDKLNPVQESMVACQGAQCGFCTPGFIVSMCAMFEQKRERRVAVDEVRAACVGNLCRCTGYEPILRAGAAVEPASMRPLNELYPPREMIDDFAARAGEAVEVRHGDRLFFKTATVEQALRFRADYPDCTVIAGGTDIGVQVNKGTRDPKTILSLSALTELRSVELRDNTIVAGALASLAQLERICQDALPEYARLLYFFGSPPIRNAGTIGGNIANGSPIGDTMPALYVLNAEVELTGVGGARRVNMNDFYDGYRHNVSRPDELVTRVIIPLPAAGDVFRLYKVSKRKDLDISAFTAAVWMKRNGGETIEDVRIAFGGVGPNIFRMRRTEDSLRGNALTLATAREAGRIARSEISPISDVRGSAEYRAQLGENILRKLYHDLTQPGANGSNGNGNGDGSPYHGFPTRAGSSHGLETRGTGK